MSNDLVDFAKILGEEALNLIVEVAPKLIHITEELNFPNGIWLLLHVLMFIFNAHCEEYIADIGAKILSDKDAGEKLKAIEEGFCDLLRRIHEKRSHGAESNDS